MKKKLSAIIVFGIAFGFVEAAVVYYLRTIFGLNSNFVPQESYKVLINLGFISFLNTGSIILPDMAVARAEILREIATIVMLISVAYVSASKVKKRIGAFFIAFAAWDIFYYVFLYFLTGWPKSIWDIDVYFLNPVPWVGPVVTAIIASSVMFLVGVKFYLSKNSIKNTK